MSRTNYHPDWRRTAGDVRDYLDAVIGGLDNLDLVTLVEADVWLISDDTTPAERLSGVVSDSATRQVRLSLEGWLEATAVAGDYYLRIYLGDAAGSHISWHEGEPMVLEVVAAAPAAP